MESALSFSVPALTYRFDVDRAAMDQFVGSGLLTEPILSSFLPDSRLEAAWNLMSTDALGEHGTLVCLLLAADLPQLKISWLPTSLGGWATKPAHAQELIKSKIRRDRPQVMNIFAAFHDDFPNCSEVLDPVFSEFSDSGCLWWRPATMLLMMRQARVPAPSPIGIATPSQLAKWALMVGFTR